MQDRVAALPCLPGCPIPPHVSSAAQATSRQPRKRPRRWPPWSQLAHSCTKYKLPHLHQPGSAAQQVMPLLVSRGSLAYSWLAQLSIAFCRAWRQVRGGGVSACRDGGTHRDAVARFESRLHPLCCTEPAPLQQLRDTFGAHDCALELWAAVPKVPKPRCYIDKVCTCRSAHSMSACHWHARPPGCLNQCRTIRQMRQQSLSHAYRPQQISCQGGTPH